MGFAAAGLLVAACSSSVYIGHPADEDDGAGGAAATSTTATTSTGDGQGGVGGAPLGEVCASINHETTLGKKPADIIFIIDNSSSMVDEINGVENNINQNFAQIMANSDVDYRVIMVTQHGYQSYGYYSVCVEPPLSGNDCLGGYGQPPVNVPGQFYHYSLTIESHDSLCQFLEGMYGAEPDHYGLAPAGFDQWLRPEAAKIFVEISDDGMTCNFDGNTFDDGDDVSQGQQAAAEWDATLLSLNPVQFGSSSERNYLFYSIVGMWWKSNKSPYEPDEPVIAAPCPAGVAGGTAYQWLSKATSSLRFPICAHESFDAVFSDIAAGVIDYTAVPCEWDMPDPDPGESYDWDTIEVNYTPAGTGAPVTFFHVDDESQCATPNGFYVENGNHVVLCNQTCNTVRADSKAELEANIRCQ